MYKTIRNEKNKILSMIKKSQRNKTTLIEN